MAKRHGKDTVVYIDGYDITGDSNQVTPKIAIDTAEITCFGDVSKSYLLGQDAGSLDHQCFFNDTPVTGVHAVLKPRIGTVVQVMTGWGTLQGGYGFAGSATLKSHSPNLPIGGAEAITNSFEGHGPLDPIKIVAPKGNIVGIGGTLNDGNFSLNGMNAYLQVFSVLGGTPIVTIETSATGTSAWGTPITFNSMTALGAQFKQAAGSISQYARVNVSGGSALAAVGYRRT